jgi:hypothetical protein
LVAFNKLSPREKPSDPPKPPNTQMDPSLTQNQAASLDTVNLGAPIQMPGMPSPSSVYGMATPQMPPTGPSILEQTNAQMMPQMGQKASAAGSGFTGQDAMMAAYLAATLGGTIGTLMKPLPPPPPIAVPQSSPNPITAPAAMHSALGLAQNRKQRTPHQFGKGG